jgi:hypothetical protein
MDRAQTPVATKRTATLWLGRVLSGLCVAFLIFDGATKVVKEHHVLEAMGVLGFATSAIVPLGVVLLVCTLLYAIPATAPFGALLLTGWLGGATAVMLRVGDPAHPFLFPVVFGVLVWSGLYLRDDRLRHLIRLHDRQD